LTNLQREFSSLPLIFEQFAIDLNGRGHHPPRACHFQY